MSDFIKNLPDEIKLRIIEQTVLAPKAHFLKPFRGFNGGLFGDTIAMFGPREGEVGVQDVSQLSGARILARMHMALSDASKPHLGRNLTPILVNPAVGPLNHASTEPTGLAQIKVDMIDDIFCVSSNGRDPWFPGQKFSGGVVRDHEMLKHMRRVCIGLPNYDRAAGTFDCQDCGEDLSDKPESFLEDGIEFCTRCIGHWFALLYKLEQVYLIVPGLAKAQRTDKHHIFRYGEAYTLARGMREARNSGRDSQLKSEILVQYVRVEGFIGQPRDLFLSDCHMTENFGTDGPQSFEGDGITLYEVAASDVPEQAIRLMETMVKSFREVRAEWTKLTMDSYPNVPMQPRICGGLIEFKFLSYEQDP